MRVSLEFGLRHLGPTGEPFEGYVARLLAAFGYRTELAARRAGRTVEHEIDIVAEREDRTLFCECKLRTKPDARVDLGTVLAAFGRAADLGALGDGPVQAWLITNARFTDDAEAFALGSGLHLLGWDQPPDSDLPSRIDEVGRYPITALPHLPDAAARRLVAAGIVDTDALLAAPQRLEDSGVLPARIAQILAEAKSVRARDTD